MNLTIVLPLFKPSDLTAACVRSLEQIANLGTIGQNLKVCLLYSESFLTCLQPDQRYRLKAIETLAHEVFGGLSLCCKDPIATVIEVAKLYPDQPIAIIDPSFYIETSALNDLDKITATMGSLDSFFLPVRTRQGVASSSRLDELAYNSSKRCLRINPFAVLNDFITDRYLIICSSGALQARLESHFDIASQICSDLGALRWIVTCFLLIGRIRLSSQQLVYCDNSLSESIAHRSYHQLRLDALMQIGKLSKNRLYKIFSEILISAWNRLLAASDADQSRCIADAHVKRNIYNSICKSLSAVITVGGSYDQSCFDALLPNKSSWSNYFEQANAPAGKNSNSAKDRSADIILGTREETASSHRQDNANSRVLTETQDYLWRPHNFSLKELPENDAEIVLFGDTLDTEPKIHAMVATHEVRAGVQYSFSCLAKAASLKEITLRLPAPVFGEEIRVNINLVDTSYTVVSGKPELVNVYVESTGLVRCELEAIAIKTGKANVAIRLCKNSNSYYLADGNGRVYFGKIRLKPVTERHDVMPSAKLGFTCHNLFIVNQNSYVPCHLLETENKYDEYQGVQLVANINAAASHEFSFVFSCDNASSIDISLPGSIFGGDGVNARFNLLDTSSSIVSGSPHRLQCTHIGDQKFECIIAAQSLTAGSQTVLFKLLPRTEEGIKLNETDASFVLHDLKFCIDQPFEPDIPCDPSISVIAVTYGMHNYIPEWLANYGLQSINSCIESELLIAEPELSLPLQLYLELFARVAKCNLHVVPLLKDPGLYECWNQLIRLSQAKYISNFNPDDRKLPEHLQTLVSVAEETGADVCSSACYISRIQEPSDVSYLPEDIMSLQEKWWASTLEKPSPYPLSCANLIKRLTPDSIRPNNQIHSMPVWTRSLHRKYGYFDEKKYSTYADFALWIQALKKGASVVFYPQLLYMFSVIETSHNRVNKDQQILDLLLFSCEK
jgi:hypothetical protein